MQQAGKASTTVRVNQGPPAIFLQRPIRKIGGMGRSLSVELHYEKCMGVLRFYVRVTSASHAPMTKCQWF